MPNWALGGTLSRLALRPSVKWVRQMNIVTKLKQKRRELGLSGVLELIKMNLVYLLSTTLDRGFDLRYGTDTSQPVHRPQLGVNHYQSEKMGTSYFPTPPRTFHRVMKNLQLDFTHYCFIEFGSGKGRVVLMAAMYSFKEVIGIEYSRLLHDIAEKNLQTMCAKGGALAPVNLYCMDAAEYKIPAEPCIFYFFHPFTGYMVKLMLDHITEARMKAPQPDRIVWLYGQALDEVVREKQLIKSYGFILEHDLNVRDQAGRPRLLHVFYRH